MTMAVRRPGEESPVSLLEASRLVLLDPTRVTFFRHGATLRATIDDDRSLLKVAIVRAFPLSEPSRYLSVRDGANKEAGLIVDPSQLDPGSQALVEAELDRRYLMPSVVRVVSARERFGTVDWVMETDRGVSRFTTRNLREHAQRPAPGRIIIPDVDGNRYDIRDVDALDLPSQELLFRHL